MQQQGPFPQPFPQSQMAQPAQQLTQQLPTY
jgi:hypothetical protein